MESPVCWRATFRLVQNETLASQMPTGWPVPGVGSHRG